MQNPTEQILARFSEIAAIPRRSKHEGQIREWIAEWANGLGFSSKTDRVGNLCVTIPGRGIDRTPIVIQGHLDMVCEKTPNSLHDFAKDGLKLIREGDWLSADGTTLGADNGVAIAMAMVLAESKEISIPPLELLFTIDEETGLTGASELDEALISGDTLLNIDSEQEGVYTIGCAGGNNVQIELPLRRVNSVAKDAQFFKLVVSGGSGGHSGIDIHKQKANAIRVLSRALLHLRQKHQLFIESIHGGSAHNAIPRDASATIAIERCDIAGLMSAVKEFNANIKSEFRVTDPTLAINLEEANGKIYFAQGATEKLLNLIHALPHGVAAMSTELSGIVDSSSNLATVETKGDAVIILTSHRSSNVLRLESLAQRVIAIGHLAECRVRLTDGYPPWQPDWDAPLLTKAKAIYKELFAKDPIVEVIHAGLECGIIGKKKPGMQMISFGPNIENAHSPDERLQISDIEKVWRLLVALVRSV